MDVVKKSERKRRVILFFAFVFPWMPLKICFCYLVCDLKVTASSNGCSFYFFGGCKQFSVTLASPTNILNLAILVSRTVIYFENR